MKKQHKITLLGSNSGRNAGDAAILAAIMGTLSEVLGEDTLFEVPTTHPGFVEKHYGEKFNVRPISVMPWTGSIRLLGVPTFLSIRRTDATLITDGVIFDVKLFNPLFNFLITLIFLVPWAKWCGKKVVCYNVGIGPLRSTFGRIFGRWVGNASDLITVRDADSKALFEEVGVTTKQYLTADSVFTNWSAEESRVNEILQKHGLAEEQNLFGFNVTSYLDTWLSGQEKVSEGDGFLLSLARTLARLKAEKEIEVVFFTTQIMDADYARRLIDVVQSEFTKLRNWSWQPQLIANVDYSNHEIQGLAARCKLFAGMRLHSLIIAARAGTPVVGMVYAPKVRSFLHQLQSPELAVELADIDEERFYQLLCNAWNDSSTIERKQQQVVADLNGLARQSAVLLAELLGKELPESLRTANLD